MWEFAPSRRPATPAPAVPADRVSSDTITGGNPPLSDTDDLRP